MEEGSSSCTVTQRLQTELESRVGALFEVFESATSKERNLLLKLNHEDHEDYVLRGLQRLGAGFYVLDSSRPWLCYWILHSLALLGKSIDEDLYDRTVDFLEHCQDTNGGYGGGPGQMAHLATTYAAVCALVTLGGEKALASINREKILQFLMRMKDPCGGFRVHDDGEMDMRGSFTALAVAHLLNIVEPKLVENVAEHVQSCQTYEGGIGGEPGSEAHGGYTFCGIAALTLIDQLHVLDLPRLVNWVAFRQGKVEGGFQGRTNKLVDGCYSFWQGGCFQLLQQHMPHLLSQQSSAVGDLCASHEDLPVPDDVLDMRDADLGHDVPAGSTSKERNIKPEENTSKTVLCEVQDDGTDEQVPASGSNLVKLKSGDADSIDVKNKAEDLAVEATSEELSSQRNGIQGLERVSNVEAHEQFHSPRMSFTSKDGSSDDDEVDEDSDSRAVQNTAEKLFPMIDIGFHRRPLHVKFVELVEVPDDDQQRTQTGVSGSSGGSSCSTSDLDSADDTLYGPIFNSQALQAYILLCCQDLEGGLRDKPGKPCDYYHTCYCLSGLAVGQYSTAHRIGSPPPPSGVVGPYSNLVEATHALCNVRLDRYFQAVRYFKRC